MRHSDLPTMPATGINSQVDLTAHIQFIEFQPTEFTAITGEYIDSLGVQFYKTVWLQAGCNEVATAGTPIGLNQLNESTGSLRYPWEITTAEDRSELGGHHTTGTVALSRRLQSCWPASLAAVPMQA